MGLCGEGVVSTPAPRPSQPGSFILPKVAYDPVRCTQWGMSTEMIQSHIQLQFLIICL